MSLKKIFPILILLSAFMAISAFHSGVKVGLDTNLLNILGRVDLNKHLQNKTVISNLTLEKSSFPAYKVNIGELTFTNVAKPEKVSISHDKASNSLSVLFEGLLFELRTSFHIKVVSLFSDQLVNSAVKISVDKVDASLGFNNNNVKINKFVVSVKDIEMQFNSIFFRTIYKFFKGLMINMINSEVARVHGEIERSINSLLSEESIINIGMGIGFNVTNTDKPEIVFVDKLDTFAKSNPASLTFLGEEKVNNFNADESKAIIKFGIHGSVFPTQGAQAVIEPAIEMNFFEKIFDNDVSLLVSDYTINTGLFMAQQSGALHKKFTNDTQNFLNMSIDTDSFSNVVQELKTKYPENKNIEVNVFVHALNHVQPKLSTDVDGSVFSLNFGIDFGVFNSTEPWDDAVKELSVNVTAHFKLQYLVQGGKLNLICFRTVIDSVEKKFDNLNADESNLRMGLDSLLNNLLKSVKPIMSNIDVFGKIAQTFNVTLSNPMILTEERYIAVAFNVNEF